MAAIFTFQPVSFGIRLARISITVCFMVGNEQRRAISLRPRGSGPERLGN
jgi:hypothetical protein